MTELTPKQLLKHQDKFSRIILPFLSLEKIESRADKYRLMLLAQALNMTLPKTAYVNVLNNLPVILSQLNLLIVLNPEKMWLEYQHEWLPSSVRFTDAAEQAMTILEQDTAFRVHSFLLQENVPYKREGILLSMRGENRRSSLRLNVYEKN